MMGTKHPIGGARNDLKLPRFGGHLIIRRRLHMPRPVLQPTAFRILPDSYSQDWSEAAYGCRIPRCSRRRQLVTANGLSTAVCQRSEEHTSELQSRVNL